MSSNIPAAAISTDQSNSTNQAVEQQEVTADEPYHCIVYDGQLQPPAMERLQHAKNFLSDEDYWRHLGFLEKLDHIEGYLDALVKFQSEFRPEVRDLFDTVRLMVTTHRDWISSVLDQEPLSLDALNKPKWQSKRLTSHGQLRYHPRKAEPSHPLRADKPPFTLDSQPDEIEFKQNLQNDAYVKTTEEGYDEWKNLYFLETHAYAEGLKDSRLINEYMEIPSNSNKWGPRAAFRGARRAAIETCLNILVDNSENRQRGGRLRFLQVPDPTPPAPKEYELYRPMDLADRVPSPDMFQITKDLIKFSRTEQKDAQDACRRDEHDHRLDGSYVPAPANFNGPYQIKTNTQSVKNAQESLKRLVSVLEKLNDTGKIAPRILLAGVITRILASMSENQALADTEDADHPKRMLFQEHIDKLLILTEPSWVKSEIDFLPLQNRVLDRRLRTFSGRIKAVLTMMTRVDQSNVHADTVLEMMNRGFAGSARFTRFEAAAYMTRMAQVNQLQFDYNTKIVNLVPFDGHPEDRFFSPSTTEFGGKNIATVRYNGKGGYGPPILFDRYALLEYASRLGRQIRSITESLADREVHNYNQQETIVNVQNCVDNWRNRQAPSPEEIVSILPESEIRRAVRRAGPRANALEIRRNMRIEAMRVIRDRCLLANDLCRESLEDIARPVIQAKARVDAMAARKTKDKVTALVKEAGEGITKWDAAMVLQAEVTKELNQCREPHFPTPDSIWQFASERTTSPRASKLVSVNRWPLQIQSKECQSKWLAGAPPLPELPPSQQSDEDPAGAGDVPGETREPPESIDDLDSDMEGVEVEVETIENEESGILEQRFVPGPPIFPFGETPYQREVINRKIEYELNKIGKDDYKQRPNRYALPRLPGEEEQQTSAESSSRPSVSTATGSQSMSPLFGAPPPYLGTMQVPLSQHSPPGRSPEVIVIDDPSSAESQSKRPRRS